MHREGPSVLGKLGPKLLSAFYFLQALDCVPPEHHSQLL